MTSQKISVGFGVLTEIIAEDAIYRYVLDGDAVIYATEKDYEKLVKFMNDWKRPGIDEKEILC